MSGYIYSCANVEEDLKFTLEIPDAIVSRKKVPVESCEKIDDALAELLKSEKAGQIKILRYNEFIAKREK